MGTYADNFLAAIQGARAQAVRLSAGSHTSRDMEKLIEDVGADLELFLKTAVYGGSGRQGIAACISGLTAFGVAQPSIDALDRLRLAYNRAKHQPGTTLSADETEALLSDATTAVETLKAAGVANVNAVEPVQVRRQFWLLAADHIISGETEIDICLPMPDVDFPPGLDIVHIGMSAWVDALGNLRSAGELREGRGSVPDRVHDVWSRESDVILIGSWAGEYRNLLRSLLPYEKVLDVLPGLARGDDFSGCLTAILMAAVDLGQSGALTGDAADIKSALLTHAEAAYSIPRAKPAAARAAEITSLPLAAIPEDARHQLSGPYWRSRAEIAAMRASASATVEGDLFAIAEDGRLVAWSGH